MEKWLTLGRARSSHFRQAYSQLLTEGMRPQSKPALEGSRTAGEAPGAAPTSPPPNTHTPLFPNKRDIPAKAEGSPICTPGQLADSHPAGQVGPVTTAAQSQNSVPCTRKGDGWGCHMYRLTSSAPTSRIAGSSPTPANIWSPVGALYIEPQLSPSRLGEHLCPEWL